MSDNPKDNLTFDITSETSIVSECNLKFTTPKDGLGSMIAIDSLGTPRHFKQHNMAALNNLNLLNQPKFTSGQKSNADQYVSVRSLPLQNSNDNTDEPALNLNFNRLNKSITAFDSSMIRGGAGSAMDAFGASQTFIRTEKQGNTDSEEEFGRENAGFDYGDAEVVNTGRDIFRNRAKRKLYDDPDQDTISPILPIEIDLSIYGNNYLNIGDYFTVNYLPTQYKDYL